MRLFRRLAFVCVLTSIGIGMPGCRQPASYTPTSNDPQAGADDKTGAKRKRRRKRGPKVNLPAPYKLADVPPAALHIASPRDVLLNAGTITQIDKGEPRALLRQALATGNIGAFERKLVPFIDLQRSLDAAIVEGKLVAHVPLLRKKMSGVEELLKPKTKAGKFGAVRLRADDKPGPKLAYLNKETATITLASDLRGIATGPKLRSKYGKRKLFVTLNRNQAKRRGIVLPVARVTLAGSGLHDFKITTEGVPEQPLLEQINNGALTGTLEAKQVALGVTTRYANYEKEVRSIIGRIDRTVEKQNFLIRGNLEDLQKRANSVLRSWNGRVMAGVGPKGHALLALGTKDTKRAAGATLHFLSGVISNIKLAKQFGVGGIPRLRLKREAGSVNGVSIHIASLDNARKFLPSELHSLVNDKGSLRIAMAFSARAGGAMLVAGNNARPVLERWLEQIKDATPAADSRDHLLAATVAVKPKTLQTTLLEAENGSAALGLSSETNPTKLVVTRSKNGLKGVVKGPRLNKSGAKPRKPPAGANRQASR